MSIRDVGDAPTAADISTVAPALAACALAHLFEQAKADTLDYYRPIGGDHWNVWINDYVDPQTGYRGLRVTLADFVCLFAAGALPSQQKGGV